MNDERHNQKAQQFKNETNKKKFIYATRLYKHIMDMDYYIGAFYIHLVLFLAAGKQQYWIPYIQHIIIICSLSNSLWFANQKSHMVFVLQSLHCASRHAIGILMRTFYISAFYERNCAIFFYRLLVYYLLRYLLIRLAESLWFSQFVAETGFPWKISQSIGFCWFYPILLSLKSLLFRIY